MGSQRVRQNPYTTRIPIANEDEFYGRAKIMADIFTRLKGSQCISLIGERRIGKSSILNALNFDELREINDVAPEYRFVLVDLQYINIRSEEDLLAYLVGEISDATGISVWGESHRHSLELIAIQAQRQELRLVIMLDEFDYLLHNDQIPPQFYAFLRAWITRFRVPFVTASREGNFEKITETDDTGSAFWNIFGNVYVGPFEEDEAIQLIQEPADRDGVEFDDEDVELVLDLAGFFPIFIQIACYHLFEHKQKGPQSEEFKEHLKRAFTVDTVSHFRYLKNRLTDLEIEYLNNFPVESNAREDRYTREGLLQKGILIRRQNETRIFSSLMKSFLFREDSSRRSLIQSVKSLLE